MLMAMARRRRSTASAHATDKVKLCAFAVASAAACNVAVADAVCWLLAHARVANAAHNVKPHHGSSTAEHIAMLPRSYLSLPDGVAARLADNGRCEAGGRG